MKLLEITVTAAILPMGALAARQVYFTRIVEGKGTVKALEIINNENEPIRYDELDITIKWNGNEEITKTQRLERPSGADSDYLGVGERFTLCTPSAFEADVDGTMCNGGMSLVGYENSNVLAFNGNDQLTLSRRMFSTARDVFKVETQDVFGDLNGNIFKVCTTENGAQDSILTRKSNVVRGDTVNSLSGNKCEWSRAALDAQDIDLPSKTWYGSNARSVLRIRERENGDFINPNDFSLSTGDSKQVRIADMEANTQRVPSQGQYYKYTNICIKQESYFPELLEECDYFWDVAGTSTPFEYYISASTTRDANYWRYSTAPIAVASDICKFTEENPLEQFGEYTESYLCEVDSDCKSLNGIIGGDAVCLSPRRDPKFCGLQERAFPSYKPCEFDEECPGEVCSPIGECRPKDELMKIRAQQANVVIPAGATETFQFTVDDLQFNYIASGATDITFVSTTGNIAVTTGPSPQFEVAGSFPLGEYDLYASTCNAAKSTATGYYTINYQITPDFDSGITGVWEFSVTNNGAEEATILGGFWALNVQAD